MGQGLEWTDHSPVVDIAAAAAAEGILAGAAEADHTRSGAAQRSLGMDPVHVG